MKISYISSERGTENGVRFAIVFLARPVGEREMTNLTESQRGWDS